MATDGESGTIGADADPTPVVRPSRTKLVLRRLALATAACLLVLVLAEFALRDAGFEFVMRPEVVEFGSPSRAQIRTFMVEDPDVFWVYKGYAENLERLRRSRPTIVFMGDSCTQIGRYDEAFARLAAAGGAPVEFGNVGVIGWSSWQGRRQLERDVLPLEPRVVTLWYGWNDHWIGYGIEDKNIGRLRDLSSPFLESLRLGQLVFKLRVAHEIGTADRPNRVSEEDFRGNLVAMVRAASARGVVPVLLTAPSAHVEGRTAPSQMVERWLRRPEDLVPMHRRYADIVRDVARVEGAPLCDLELEMHRFPQSELDDKYFKPDGIHLAAAGDERVGALLFETLRRGNLLPRLKR